MNRLIFFHPQKKSYIEAIEYQHYTLEKDLIFSKLDEIVSNNPDSLIIFRINFENIAPTKEQKKIYNLPFADIYLVTLYKDFKPSHGEQKKFPLYDLSPMVNKDDAKLAIEKIKNKIKNGYFYQVNYSLPFRGKTATNLSPEELFLALRNNFQGDFHALIPISNDLHLMSFSPELFLCKDQHTYYTEPIKGTAKKGQNLELLNSEKENAELSMIVDLMRNDLNEVCKDPVKVIFHRHILELTHLIHTYSRVEGISQKSLGSILQKMLPGGSISGCPKKESVDTIYQLEPYAREHYTGIIGVIHKDQMRSSIVIRALLYDKSNGNFTYNAGSGIVYDSNASEEIAEIYLKSKSLLDNPAWDRKITQSHLLYSKPNSSNNTSKKIYKPYDLLFSTLLLSADGIENLDLHLERIYSSLEALKREVFIPKFELKQRMQNFISKLDITLPQRLRINISPDAIFLEWLTLTPYKDLLTLDFATTPIINSKNYFLNHKLNQYENYYNELKNFPNDVDDIIFINENGLVTESTKANLFFIDHKNQVIFTPPITDGLLPGIIRQKLISQKSYTIDAKEYLIIEKSLSKMEVQEKYHDLLITNSLMGIRRGKLKK